MTNVPHFYCGNTNTLGAESNGFYLHVFCTFLYCVGDNLKIQENYEIIDMARC